MQCPLCHADVDPERRLEDHLLEEHSKSELAKLIVAETEAMDEEDISE